MAQINIKKEDSYLVKSREKFHSLSSCPLAAGLTVKYPDVEDAAGPLRVGGHLRAGLYRRGFLLVLPDSSISMHAHPPPPRGV